VSAGRRKEKIVASDDGLRRILEVDDLLSSAIPLDFPPIHAPY